MSHRILNSSSIALLILALPLMAGCGDESADEAQESSGTTQSSAATASPVPTPSDETPSTSASPSTTEGLEVPDETEAPEEAKSDDPAVECANRKTNQGEILVRDTVGNDGPTTTYRLGGGWVWSFGDEKCFTSTESAIRISAPFDGYCTEVGRVKDNKGYPEDGRCQAV